MCTSQEILSEDEGEQQFLKEVLALRGKQMKQEEILVTNPDNSPLWLDMSIIPMSDTKKEASMFILCSDITERKSTQEKIEDLTQRSFEYQIKQKQQQASQVVAGQEEERKRIAKDIHDGIGQMLTALKFNIESIKPEQIEKTTEKVQYLKNLTGELIKGVRTATFNLNPPELEDHGVFPALQKMTVELSKLTGKKIIFQNKSEISVRFDALAETNIYRVTQEAVNNAVKYAQSSYILVSMNIKNDMLSVVIDDDGIGFDPSQLKDHPENASEGGMGVFFMKERMGYVNGRIFINSAPGEGTRVTVNYIG